MRRARLSGRMRRARFSRGALARLVGLVEGGDPSMARLGAVWSGISRAIDGATISVRG